MSFSLFDLFWLFLIAASFSPMVQQYLRESRRMAVIRTLERRRQSRVVTLIHRQESLAFLGIPISRYIDIDDSEAVLRAIKLTPDEMPLDIVMHTPGGLVLAAEQIAHALVRRSGPVTVFIPHYAMSGGTLLALAADEIVMDENAVLGPVDPQIGQYAAADILRVLDLKPPAAIDDETLIRAEVARKAMRQVYELVVAITRANGMDEEASLRVAQALTTGRWTHDYPITVEKAKELGLPVRVGLPPEVYELMELYPQPAQRRPSVQYVPVPYEREPRLPRRGR
ncbi:MAG: hypothetical protein QJR14_00620 [Bacillota bacterium]|nr:hypothetical protein [Bacillota bacterium]